jgi:hypothetical protein
VTGSDSGPEQAAECLLEKEVKRQKKVEGVRPSFIDVESGTGPVHAPYLKRGVAKLGGADRSTKIILYKILL